MPDAEFQVLLGRDVLPHLGITIAGLSVTFQWRLNRRIKLLDLAESTPDESDEKILKQMQLVIETNRNIPEDSARNRNTISSQE